MNANPTVLIVDDDAAGREAINGVLYAQNYDLISAENGQAALDLAREHIPDLILLDVMMPEMDGFQVCQQLRQDPILCEIPVLMVTALDDRDSRLRGIEAGADDFISKPFDRIELRARVRTVTRLNRYRHLLLERARFVWVIENDQDGYLIVDENDLINFANATARRLLNLPGEEQLQTPTSFLPQVKYQFLCVPPERWATWPFMSNEEEPLYLLHLQSEDQRPKWYEVYVLDLPWVTKNQRLLRIKDTTQSMELRLETWSFQTAARHKLMTPLSNITLSLGLMRMLLKNNSLSELEECIRVIEVGARRLECEYNDIMQYIYTPLVAKSDGVFKLSDFEKVAAHIANETALKNIEISTDHPSILSFSIPLSHRAIQIILWELIDNAKKFHPKLDPTIQVELSHVSPGTIQVKITDDGIWIPSEHLNYVFVPYYQGEKTYSGEIDGMGLGLSTVAALIWQAGGDITMHNRHDTPGVVVEIRLPALD
jgi:two-component system, cell cycle response regulator